MGQPVPGVRVFLGARLLARRHIARRRLHGDRYSSPIFTYGQSLAVRHGGWRARRGISRA